MGLNIIKIGEHKIGINEKPFIIAEIAQAHDGSLGMAHAYINAVAEAGANAVKFQTHIASEESTLDEPWRIKFSLQDGNRYEYWRRMEFTENQWKGLAAHARDHKLIFLSSPFCYKAFELLKNIGMNAWKVASGEAFNSSLIKAMADTGAPILLSTGMSNFGDINQSVETIRKSGADFALLQCTSRYPVTYEHVGLNLIQEFKSRYLCPAGLSDHSGSIFPALAAMALGADIIEVHVVFDKRLFGPDVLASITVDDLKIVTDARDAFYTMASNPVGKDSISEEMEETKSLFTKSVALLMPVKAGTKLEKNMLTLKKPGSGIPESELENLIGRRLKRNLGTNRLLRWEDLDG